jgi:hypothetical protein
MVSQVLTRINDCALRENTVSSIQQTQKFLENKINSKFSHVEEYMKNLDKKIEGTDKDLGSKIQDIKKKTLGKITGICYKIVRI